MPLAPSALRPRSLDLSALGLELRPVAVADGVPQKLRMGRQAEPGHSLVRIHAGRQPLPRRCLEKALQLVLHANLKARAADTTSSGRQQRAEAAGSSSGQQQRAAAASIKQCDWAALSVGLGVGREKEARVGQSFQRPTVIRR